MSDPAEEAERRRALRDEEERARRAAQHDIENLTRKQPGVYGQRVHAACIKTPGQPPEHWLLCWSTLARLSRDARSAGLGREITDLGPTRHDPAAFDRGTLIVKLKRAPEGHRCGP